MKSMFDFDPETVIVCKDNDSSYESNKEARA